MTAEITLRADSTHELLHLADRMGITFRPTPPPLVLKGAVADDEIRLEPGSAHLDIAEGSELLTGKVRIAEDGAPVVNAKVIPPDDAKGRGRGRPRKDPAKAVAPLNETSAAQVLAPPAPAAPAAPAVQNVPGTGTADDPLAILDVKAITDSILLEGAAETLELKPPFTLAVAKEALHFVMKEPGAGPNAAGQILAKFNSGRTSEVPGDQYPGFLAACRDAINTARLVA